MALLHGGKREDSGKGELRKGRKVFVTWVSTFDQTYCTQGGRGGKLEIMAKRNQLLPRYGIQADVRRTGSSGRA